MRVATINRPVTTEEARPLPPDPLAEALFAWAAPVAGGRDLVCGLIVVVIGSAVLLASVLS